MTSEAAMREGSANRVEKRGTEERRGSTRFELSGTAWFQWEAGDGQSHEGAGVTRNVSGAGAFIATRVVPPVDARVHVVLTFAVGWREDFQVRLSGAGSVRHKQQEVAEGGGFGAGVAFHAEPTTGNEGLAVKAARSASG